MKCCTHFMSCTVVIAFSAQSSLLAHEANCATGKALRWVKQQSLRKKAHPPQPEVKYSQASPPPQG